jgi:hypothetical protein
MKRAEKQRERRNTMMERMKKHAGTTQMQMKTSS